MLEGHYCSMFNGSSVPTLGYTYIRPPVVVVLKFVYTLVLLENFKKKKDPNVLTCSMVE